MPAERIVSAANPLLKDIRRAVARGTLTDDGFCIAETPHLLAEALRSGCEVKTVLVRENTTLAVRVPSSVRVISLPPAVFKGVAATEAPQGVIALVRPGEWTAEQLLAGCPLAVVLDGVQDPGNAGTILRSAEAFGATGVVLLKGSVSAHNPKTVRASAGSVFRVPCLSGVTVSQARSLLAGLTLYAAAADGSTDLPAADFARPCALVIGSEGRGVSPEMREGATGLRIPTLGVESLNAAMAAAILLYEARRQRTSR